MYFDVLAGLRGLLALFVFIAHAWQWWGGVFFGNNKFGESLSLIAYFSVLGFFVLSGYLISVSIEKNISENPQELLLNYCVNRLTRIVPPFMLAVSFSLFVLLFIKYLDLHGAISFRINDFEVIARENVSIVNRNIFATFILSNGIMPGTGPIDSNGPLWSLSIEFWMYFIGLALYFLITKSHINYKLISLLFVLAFLVLKPIYLYFWSFYVYSIFWIIGFSLNFEITKKWLSLFSGPVSACIAILGLFLASSACGFVLAPSNSLLWIVISILVVYLGIISVIYCRPLMFILKKLRFLEYSSYTLYILHFPIFYLQFSIMHKFVCDLHSFYALISVGFLVLANYLICILLGRFLENKKIFRPIIYKYLVRVLGSSI